MEKQDKIPLKKSYSTIDGETLHLYFYQARGSRKNTTIFYLHGGGLVYGSPTDLPDAYLDMLLDEGYDFITWEYPLAPEAKLGLILEKLLDGIQWFQKNYHSELALSSPDYILFGRSAGAYLAIILAQKAAQKPDALLLFYGYHTLQEASFRVPSRHYLAFPPVEERVISQIIQSKPIVEGPMESRFALYIYYRQTGKWVKEILAPEEQASDFSLSNSDLAALPPAFLAASTGDPDVPYRLSKKMAAQIPRSHLETMVGNEHDFDRTTIDSIGSETYRKMLAWLEETLKNKNHL